MVYIQGSDWVGKLQFCKQTQLSLFASLLDRFGCVGNAFCSIREYRHKTIWKCLDFKYVKNKSALQIMLFVCQNMYQFTSVELLVVNITKLTLCYEVNIF